MEYVVEALIEEKDLLVEELKSKENTAINFQKYSFYFI